MDQHRVGQFLFLVFTLCIFTLSLGQFSVIYTFGQGSVYLFDTVIAFFDLFGCLYLTKFGQLKIPLPIISLLTFVALGLISLMSTPLNLEILEFVTALGYSVRFLSYLLFATTIWNFIRLGIFQTDKIYRAIIYSGVFLFVAGVLQLIILPDLETLNPLLGWDPHKNRMASTFFDPNFLGMYFVICLATVLKFIHAPSIGHLPDKRALTHNLSIMLFIIGIVITFSRSAWMAAAILLFFALLKKKTLLLVSLAIAGLAIFAVPRIQMRISGTTDPQDSASFRLISWQNTWKVIQDNWVFGIGYNAFRYAQRDYGFLDNNASSSRSGAGSDSSLLLVWATSGIFGLCFFVCFLISVSLRAVKHSDLATVGLVTALLVDSLFINSLFYPQIIIMSLIFLTSESVFA